MNMMISNLKGKKMLADGIHPVTLSFKKPEIEKTFCDEITSGSIKLTRLSLLLAIAIFLVFQFLEESVIPGGSEVLLSIRFTGVIFFTCVIVLSFVPAVKKHFQKLMIFVVLTGGAVVIALVLAAQSYGMYYYYAGLILTVIYAHSLLRLRFIFAVSTTWILISTYFILIINFFPAPGEVILNNAFFLLSANTMGMFASYGIEYFMRSGFLNKLILLEKSRELESEYNRESKELEAAKQIQLSMLPDNLPEHPSADISVFMKTASEVGGDYYDFTRDEENNLIFAVGDATGHGAQAVAMVTAMKILFSNYASKLDPVSFLKKANRAIKQVGLKNLYMTFAIGKIKGNTFEIAGVGIPPMLICRKRTGVIERVNLSGLPLGSYVEFPYKIFSFTLKPGDSLMIMTDGLPELFNRDKEMLGYERVEKVFYRNRHKNSRSLTAEYLEMIDEWTGQSPLNDDLTLMVIKVKENKQMKGNYYERSIIGEISVN